MKKIFLDVLFFGIREEPMIAFVVFVDFLIAIYLAFSENWFGVMAFFFLLIMGMFTWGTLYIVCALERQLEEMKDEAKKQKIFAEFYRRKLEGKQ